MNSHRIITLIGALCTSSRRSRLAYVPACVLPGLLMSISFIVPPQLNADPGWGFLAWHGTLRGFPNQIVSPDPADIARDAPRFVATYSPGQYLIPGVLSLTGLPVGISITITVGAFLTLGLVGWLQVIRRFLPDSKIGIALVFLISTCRYSTAAFGTYNGGEILLEGVAPWIFLAANWIPNATFTRAALCASGLVVGAFVAKLSGLIVVAAALAAAIAAALARDRRLRPGMVGGVVGAAAAIIMVYYTYIVRGWTAASETHWGLPLGKVAYAVSDAWVAGLGWGEALAWVFLNPSRPVLRADKSVALFIVPIALFIAYVVLEWRPRNCGGRIFRNFAIVFCLLYAASFAMLFLRGAAVSVEERFYVPSGLLVLVCVLGYIEDKERAGNRGWKKIALVLLCTAMSVYGMSSFASRVERERSQATLDRESWTNQPIVDIEAVNFVRDAYSRDGQRSVFVLPSPDLSVTMPVGARVIDTHIDFESVEQVRARTYHGVVAGRVYVLIQNRLADSVKGQLLLAGFLDYSLNDWNRKNFGSASVFVQ